LVPNRLRMLMDVSCFNLLRWLHVLVPNKLFETSRVDPKIPSREFSCHSCQTPARYQKGRVSLPVDQESQSPSSKLTLKARRECV